MNPRKGHPRRAYGSSIHVRTFESISALFVLVTFSYLLVTFPANCQTLYGSIVGVVSDPSGAVVPDATVKATQTETQEVRTATTNDSGFFTLSTVPAGTYVISISKSGFDVFEARDVELRINTTVRIDAKLTIGTQLTRTIVSANAANLQTDRVDVVGALTGGELRELPQPTRTYEGLLGLLPGIAPPVATPGGTNNPARSMIISANGTSASGTNVSIDGVSATNPWVQFFSTAVPSTDAIETVNVVTASSSADQGVVNGAVIRVQIKSGTNSLHGLAYWYNENNSLKAKPYSSQLERESQSTSIMM